MEKEKVDLKGKLPDSALVIAVAEGTINSGSEVSGKPEKKSKVKKLTNWKNEPTFEQLNHDYTMALTDHQEFLQDLYRWRENLDGGKEIDVPRNRSKARPKLIKKQAEWKYPTLEEPFLSTDHLFLIRPRTYEDTFRAEQNQMYINYQFSTKLKKNKIVTEIVRNLVNEGTAVTKSGWEIEEKEIEVMEDQPVFATPEQTQMIVQQKLQIGEIDINQAQEILNSGSPMQIGTKKVPVMKTVLTKNQPTVEVCDNESIIIDPTARGIVDDLRFVIHEYETDMAELRKDEFSEDTYIDEETGERVTNISGKYKNLDYITSSDMTNYNTGNNNIYKSKTQFNFDTDDTRRKFKAYDYWGFWDINGDGVLEPIVATWVGTTIIRMQKNPFPHKKIPFSFGSYIPVVGKIRGLPDGELLEENQDQIGKLTRAINDMIASQAIGQTFIDDQFFPSRTEKDNYMEGRTVYYRHGMDPKKSIYSKQIEPIDSTSIQMINMYNAEAEALSGTKSFSGGIGSQAFGSVAQGIRSAMDAVSKREISILRRISEDLIADIGRKIISMNQAYIDEMEMIRVTNTEFVTVKREDLAGEFDLICDVSTAEKDNETAQDLAMLAQTNAATMDPEINKMIWAKILKLKKQPDLAQQILEFKPEPDPVAEQLKQMQLQNSILLNEKLKKEIEEIDSRVHERVSRVLENEQDVGTKMANQKLMEAQANKTQAEADNLDRQFIDDATGKTRENELEDKVLSAKTDYEKMRMEMMNSNARVREELDHKNMMQDKEHNYNAMMSEKNKNKQGE